MTPKQIQDKWDREREKQMEAKLDKRKGWQLKDGFMDFASPVTRNEAEAIAALIRQKLSEPKPTGD